ncbi:hypothetical protein Bhyg_01743 [Pseudolycoriella hygida]|uniref:Uncharacterized protein n=1 Tax=Pseudolycoriella hygida TaxID=35572 RepID=A0A9Q0NA37_9DIPT|nr:hypothetical protein Bhyg_01743 [Pseudolycoriella hygida]
MKVAFCLIILSIALVFCQDSFPPCKWSSAQWTSFKQCLGTQTGTVVTKCLRQQSSAKDWNAMKNAICSSNSKKEGVKNCLMKDVKSHSTIMRCNERLNSQNSRSGSG